MVGKLEFLSLKRHSRSDKVTSVYSLCSISQTEPHFSILSVDWDFFANQLDRKRHQVNGNSIECYHWTISFLSAAGIERERQSGKSREAKKAGESDELYCARSPMKVHVGKH